jgi:WD40 repeat protein
VWETAIDDHVVALPWSQAHNLLAAAAVSGPIHLLDATTGQPRHVLPGHGFGTSAAAWSAVGAHLASSGQDGKIRLWDVTTGKATHELSGGAAWVERLEWCANAELLASAAGKKLRLWNAQGEMLRDYPEHAKTIADVRWKPNDQVLASTCYGKLNLWSPEQAAPVGEFDQAGAALTIAWSPDGHYLATGDQDATVHFWSLKTGKDLQMAGYSTKVRAIAWDATSRYLATGGGETVCVWDCSGKGPKGTKPKQLEAHKENVAALAFQHQGALLASGGDDGLLALWHPAKQLGTLSVARLGSPVVQLTWSADDKRLAAGTAEGGVFVFAVN